MQISRYFHFDSINWDVLPELSTRLARHGVTLEKAGVTLSSFPDSIEVESLEAAQEVVRRGFQPDAYALWVRCKQDSTSLHIRLRRHQLSDGRSQWLALSGSTDEVILSSVADFLGLRPVEVESLPPLPSRTVCVAHRFDELGTSCAEKTARFLELLGFHVVTGRGYAPISVAEKVRTRLLSQAIIIAILTPGDDSTWLVQESVLGESHGKRLPYSVTVQPISHRVSSGTWSTSHLWLPWSRRLLSRYLRVCGCLAMFTQVQTCRLRTMRVEPIPSGLGGLWTWLHHGSVTTPRTPLDSSAPPHCGYGPQ